MTEKTTLRRQATETFGAGSEALAIVWVFPEVDGRMSQLAPGRTVLGRDFSCDIRLPGDETSRQHAEIVREGALLSIQDLGSTNGVYVDGAKVARSPIELGSVIRIGDWIGVLRSLPREQLDPPAFRELAPGYYGGPQTRAALASLVKAAASDLPVVVEGETGTGKEGVARAAHLWSGRTGPFVAVNCAALPETLAEAELFGYRKGAFTSADRASSGFFQAAHRGTLFLDELTDLPQAIQPKLLRALEQREVTPIGESKAVAVDVRVVVATQVPLARAVAEKRFRADLLARLDGVHVALPPLAARVEEVPFLFVRLLRAALEGRKLPTIDAAAVESLCCYDWPLNVRELTNVAKKIVALHGDEPSLKRAQLAPLLGAVLKGIVTKDTGRHALAAKLADADDDEPLLPAPGEPAPPNLTPGEQEERRRILEVLQENAGSQTATARALKMSRGTLIERLKKYGIRRPRALRSPP